MSTTMAEEHKVEDLPAEEVVVELGADGVAMLRLGRPDERLLTLTETRLRSLERSLERLGRERGLRGVIVTGPGKGMFAAGADIHAIGAIEKAEDGERAAVTGRSIFARFQQLKVPVVAAIEGPCVGGGCELVLFCDLRVASDRPGTLVGLPETKLGIVPGFGGTQQLTRLVGLPAALDVILQGRTLDPRRARRIGLVDRVVPENRLLDAAREEVERLAAAGRKAPRRRLTGRAFWLSRFPALRQLVASRARKALGQGQARFYEAPRRALELCLDALRLPPEQGFAREAKVLGELIVSPTCKSLVRLFFLTERSKRLGKHDDAKEIGKAVVVGGGVMGGGIAGLLASKGIVTRLCDVDGPALARGKARLAKNLDKQVRARRLQPHEARAIQDRLAVGTDWGNLLGCDLFLEAVVENLDLKRQLLAQAVQHGLPGTAILATNTSSLSIDGLASGLPHPERVVGIHFFNPPEKMPLVEVIRGPRTSPGVVATACRLALALGKHPVVVRDSAGFLVNRCLSPYLNEAARLLLEGNDPESIDLALLDFGMPMGPCRLLDEIGFDVASKVSEVMAAAFPGRMEPSALFAAMVDAKRLGSKSGGGLYDPTGKQPGPGREVLQQLRAQRGGTVVISTRSQVVERLIYPMVDEAYRCLDEGLVEAEDDLDLGLVMGIGFPPFTGGITRFARREGLRRIVERLDDLARSIDPRFQPADGLRRRAVNGP
jgi:3-hydroxyacyl-CoA dehydrogenase/enoyl-CoA hydratase/3-hydroxybutyryl-CoA epimerase